MPARSILLAAGLSLAALADASAQRRSKDDEPVEILRLEKVVDVGRTPTVAEFSARGDLFVSCAYDTAIEIYDGKDFEQKGRHRLSPLAPKGLIPLKSGKELFFANYAADTVHWLDLKKGELIAELKLKFKPATVVVARNGRTAAVACDTEQEVMFVDLGSRRQDGEPIILNGKPAGMAFDPRGSNLFVVTGEPTPTFVRIQVNSHAVGFWDTPLRSGSPLVMKADGKELYAARGDGGLLVLNPAGGASDPALGGAVLKEIPLEAKFHDLQLLTRDAGLVALDSLKEELWVIDPDTGEVRQKIATGKGPTDIAMGRDPKTLVVTNRSAGTISVYAVK